MTEPNDEKPTTPSKPAEKQPDNQLGETVTEIVEDPKPEMDEPTEKKA